MRQTDYEPMRLEYIRTDVSLRGLAEKHGVRSVSALTRIARVEGWDRQRADYRILENQRTIEALAEKRAQKIAQIDDDFLQVVHAAIMKMGLDMESRWETDADTGQRVFIRGQIITPSELTKVMDKYLAMTGRVTAREAHLGLNIDATGDIPRDVLRSLRQLALEQGAGQQPVGQSPLPRIEGPKQVN